MGISVHDALFSDLPFIVAIYNSTISSRMVTADIEPVTIESRHEWYYQHNTKTRPLWIVKTENNESIGWVSFQNFYGRPAYNATAEVSLYLHTSHREKGYGKKILMHCIEAAPSFGIKNLIGFIFSHNIRSVQLFQKAGFISWGTLPNVAVLDGVERSLGIFGKRLDSRS